MLFNKIWSVAAVAAASLALVTPANAVTIITANTQLGVIAPGETVVCDGVTNCEGSLNGTFINFFTSISGIAAALPGNNTSQIAVLGGGKAVLAVNRLIKGFSLDWGTVDSANFIQVVGRDGSTQTFGGQLLLPIISDDNLTVPNVDLRATFTFDRVIDVVSIDFGSNQNSFEFDNVAISAVPEPATWAMMLVGFGAIGATARKRSVRTVLA